MLVLWNETSSWHLTWHASSISEIMKVIISESSSDTEQEKEKSSLGKTGRRKKKASVHRDSENCFLFASQLFES